MEPYGIIYRVTCLKNNKVYIGLTTKSLHKRLVSHFQRAFKGESFYFYKAIRKYGKENFIFEQIDQADSLIELNEKEIFWINLYKSTNPKIGYNEKEGGGSAPLTNRIKELIRKKHMGMKASEETREKMSKASLEKRKILKKYKEMWTSEKRKKWSEMFGKEKNAMHGISMLQRLQNKWGVEEGTKKYEKWKIKIKEIHSSQRSGKNNPMAGVSPLQRLVNKYGEIEGKKRYDIWKSKLIKIAKKIRKKKKLKIYLNLFFYLNKKKIQY